MTVSTMSLSRHKDGWAKQTWLSITSIPLKPLLGKKVRTKKRKEKLIYERYTRTVFLAL